MFGLAIDIKRHIVNLRLLAVDFIVNVIQDEN